MGGKLGVVHVLVFLDDLKEKKNFTPEFVKMTVEKKTMILL